MNVPPFLDDGLDGVGRELSIGAAREEKLRSVGKEFRRAAFVRFDMGDFVADHAVIALAKMRYCQCVCRGAGEAKENLASIGFEKLPQKIGSARGPGVVPVARHVPGCVSGEKTCPGLRANAGLIVAGELMDDGHRNLKSAI